MPRKNISPLEKLKIRVEKQFKTKKIIGDIHIDDNEYELLKTYFKNKYSYIANSNSHEIIDALFAVALVQIGLKEYDGNYWEHVEEILNVNKLPVHKRNWIGQSYLNTLRYYNKIYIPKDDQVKFVNNILLHTFVSTKRINNFFLFLYQYYQIDLERDIERNTRESMNALCNAIIEEGSKDRTYLLDKHTAYSVKLNLRGSKIRIRRLLKIIDKYFWYEEENKRTNNRINNLLYNWLETSKEFKADFQNYYKKEYHEKSFTVPKIKYDFEEQKFCLNLPSELINNDNINLESKLEWNIYVENEYYNNVDVYLEKGISGYKTVNVNVGLSYSNIFKNIRIELNLKDSKLCLRKYKISASQLRLFNSKGFHIDTKLNLLSGKIYIFTNFKNEIKSKAIVDTWRIGSLKVFYLELEDGDVITLPDNKVIYIGKELKEGISAKGRLLDIKAVIEDSEIKVYNKYPSFIVKVSESKLRGSYISINNKKYRFTELEVEEIFEKDEREEKYYLVSVKKEVNGINNVVIDIPNDYKNRKYSFIYINNFNFDFENKPYIFQRRATLECNRELILDSKINVNKVIDKELYYYSFNMKNDEDKALFKLSSYDNEISFKIDLPRLSWHFGNDDWSIETPKPIFYSDFNPKLYIKGPFNEISLVVNKDSEDEYTQNFKKINNNEEIYCDLTKFLSHIDRDTVIKVIYIKINEKFYEFLKIITKSYIRNSSFIADYNNSIILGSIDILGKGEYVLDISYKGMILKEKVELIDGNFQCELSDINDGIYKFIVYEKEEDEFGFDDDYICIGEIESKIYNKLCLSNSVLKIIDIYSINNDIKLPLNFYDYYICNMKKINARTYKARLVFVKNQEAEYIQDIEVLFYDLNKLNQVYISFYDNEDTTEYLYDSDEKILVENENVNLNKRECYRRYEFVLYKDEFIYNVQFTTIDQKMLDKWLKFRETSRITYSNKNDCRKVEMHIMDEFHWKDETKVLVVNDKYSIYDLNLSTRVQNILCTRIGIKTVGELKNFCEKNNIADIKLIGKRKKEEIYNALKRVGVIIHEK